MNPFENKDLIESFVDSEWQSFVDWCESRNLNPYNLGNQIEYCNFYERAFIDYSAEYEQDVAQAEAEKSWEQNEEK